MEGEEGVGEEGAGEEGGGGRGEAVLTISFPICQDELS